MICWWCGLCSGKIISVAKYDCLYSRNNDVLAHACHKGSQNIKGAMFGDSLNHTIPGRLFIAARFTLIIDPPVYSFPFAANSE